MNMGFQPPLPGTKGVCVWCGEAFILTSYQRSDIRRGIIRKQFCNYKCQNAWHRATFNPSIARDHAKDISEARLKLFADRTGYQKIDGRHAHRTAAEKKLHRKLREGEVVHHKDGNKRNNDPSNLQVMTQSAHARLHMLAYQKKKRGG